MKNLFFLCHLPSLMLNAAPSLQWQRILRSDLNLEGMAEQSTNSFPY